MAYRNQLLSEGKTIYHVFEVATNRKVASFLNENYAHNCAANRSFNNLLVVVEEHPSGHIEKTVYLDGDNLSEMTIGDQPPVDRWERIPATVPRRPRRPLPNPSDPWNLQNVKEMQETMPKPTPKIDFSKPFKAGDPPPAPKFPTDPQMEKWIKNIMDKLKPKPQR